MSAEGWCARSRGIGHNLKPRSTAFFLFLFAVHQRLHDMVYAEWVGKKPSLRCTNVYPRSCQRAHISKCVIARRAREPLLAIDERTESADSDLEARCVMVGVHVTAECRHYRIKPTMHTFMHVNLRL